MYKKTLIIFIIIALTILVLGLVFIGGYRVGQREVKIQTAKAEFLQGELEKFYPPLPEEITRISGEVLKIENKVIDLKTKIRVRRFPEPGKDIYDETIKKVIVTNETKIYQIDRKGKITPEGGLPTIDLKFLDIKTGDHIAAGAKVDVKNLESFEAESVELLF